MLRAVHRLTSMRSTVVVYCVSKSVHNVSHSSTDNQNATLAARGCGLHI
jgi:hypothetical protein